MHRVPPQDHATIFINEKKIAVSSLPGENPVEFFCSLLHDVSHICPTAAFLTITDGPVTFLLCLRRHSYVFARAARLRALVPDRVVLRVLWLLKTQFIVISNTFLVSNPKLYPPRTSVTFSIYKV